MSIEGTATWNAQRLRWNAAERAIAAEADMEAGRPVARFLPTLAEHRAATRRARLAQMGQTSPAGKAAPRWRAAGVRTNLVGRMVVHQLSATRSVNHVNEAELRAECRYCR